MCNWLLDQKCFGNKYKTESELVVGTFSFFLIAKTLSVWKSIAHDPALKLYATYLDVYWYSSAF